MAKWDLFVTIRGPKGETDIPNNSNPIEAPDVHAVMHRGSAKLPNFKHLDAEVIGLRCVLHVAPVKANKKPK